MWTLAAPVPVTRDPSNLTRPCHPHVSVPSVQRYLDLILNRSTRDVFLTRSKIINFIRRFLDM